MKMLTPFGRLRACGKAAKTQSYSDRSLQRVTSDINYISHGKN